MAKCGEPGKDDSGRYAFASKSYVNTSVWDTMVVDWALATRASHLVVDVPYRWGCIPSTCPGSESLCDTHKKKSHIEGDRTWGLVGLTQDAHEEVVLLERLREQVPSHVWVIVIADPVPRKRFPDNFVFFPLRLLLAECYPGADDVFESVPHGHGHAGIILEQLGRLLLQLIARLPPRRHARPASNGELF